MDGAAVLASFRWQSRLSIASRTITVHRSHPSDATRCDTRLSTATVCYRLARCEPAPSPGFLSRRGRQELTGYHRSRRRRRSRPERAVQLTANRMPGTLSRSSGRCLDSNLSPVCFKNRASFLRVSPSCRPVVLSAWRHDTPTFLLRPTRSNRYSKGASDEGAEILPGPR